MYWQESTGVLLRLYSVPQYHIIRLLAISGARCSEILNLTWNDVTPRGCLFVKGLKHSRGFTIDYPCIHEMLRYRAADNDKIFGTITRITIHRTCIKFGLYISGDHQRNKKTTHSFRHNKAKDFDNLVLSDREKADILNHNSTKSQAYYFKKVAKNKKG